MKEVWIKTMLGWEKIYILDGAVMRQHDCHVFEDQYLKLLRLLVTKKVWDGELDEYLNPNPTLQSVNRQSHQGYTAQNAGDAINRNPTHNSEQ